jgi:Alpha/beta hydrolase domain
MLSGTMNLINEIARAAGYTGAFLIFAGAVQAQSPNIVAVPGTPTLLLGNYDLASLGYRVDEFFLSGTASSYKLTSGPSPEGRWNAVASGTASYTTRIVVVRPTDPTRFNGTVVVEWLNVSAGTDGSPDWNMTHREIIRAGYAYVGVSAQKAGIEGGGLMAVAGAASLKKANAERYAPLSHPGDAFSYDIFSQVVKVLRKASSNPALGGLTATRVLAMGESQSAVFLTTYVNAIDPLTKEYDGFLIHSRFGGAASLDSASMMVQGGPPTVKFRPDLRAPVIAVITETDLLDGNMPGYHGARVPDNNHLRVWEVPGTSHADMYAFTTGHIDSGLATLEKLAEANAPSKSVLGGNLAKPVNNAPQQHYVVSAALSNLDRWVRTGKAAPSAMPMTLKEGDQPGARQSLVVDAYGLAEGGVRTPWMDVPTAHLSGVGNSGGMVAFMAGVCEPFDAATLDRLYPGGKKEYLSKFEAALDSAIQAGFILAADRREILGLAAITYQGSN